ncbi:phage tail tape measure protein [Pseudomonas sp. Irchel 3H3]|uniref:phage tail tape measure protein n=1 Tax=Pseudomonas sp. Irchel 3H3 TaxID=2009038 RepID=UPI000BA45580|nr:phage tail tape measure protein [Pseudomonas sp. Irchel 3H3]
MASRLALSLVIGGAVASSVGAAFKTVESGIQKLEAKGTKAKVLKSTIGETIKLREEWKRAHDTGAASADGLHRKLNTNLEALRKQGVEVGRLGREYQRLGREAKATDLQLKGHQQLQVGKSSLKSNIGAAVVGAGMTAIPTKISATYQAIIRDIAIKADIVNKPGETQLTRTVIDTAQDTGMSRNDVADLVNQLVGAGMDLNKALSYAPTAAKFAIGQGASGVDTASMIMALQQNAKINDPRVMQEALEAIAYQGQAGSFEASDMAKWFPQLLASMEKNGSTGMDAVTSLGAMLQVQMKTAGSSDEAANNLKNWMEKIGSSEVVGAYKDAGIDYQASLNTGIQKGMSTLESSMALALKYVEATDPAKAQKIKDAQAGIDKEVNPEKAKAALDALEKTLRTGDIFADMQVKAALTAYAQNRGLYNELKADSQKATGILDKNLAERRETSAQHWSELGQAVDDSMRSIGDAIRPATDAAAKGLTWVARGMTSLSDNAQPVVLGIAGIAAAVGAFLTVSSGVKIGRGVFNIARGRGLERFGGRASRGDGSPLEVPKTGNKVLDTGIGVLGKVFGASAGPASANESEAGGSDLQRVFVVNAEAFGGIGGSMANRGPTKPVRGSRRSRQRARRRAGAMGATVRPTPVEVLKAPVAKRRVFSSASSAMVGNDDLGKVARSIRGVSRLAKRLPGGNIVDAGATALDVAINANTQDEKAEGYGAAGGSLAGTLAGAAAGAAIGSVVPVIGTAVGGAVGAVLGGLGGESLGGWLGKKLFGEDQPEGEGKTEAETTPVTSALRVTLAPTQDAKPAIGDTLRVSVAAPVAEVVKPTVLPAPREPMAKAPLMLPAATDNRALLPVAYPVPTSPPVPAPGDAVRDLAKATAPAPAVEVVEPTFLSAPREPVAKAPLVLPAAIDNRAPQRVADPVPATPPAPALGDAMRDLAKATTPAPAAEAVKAPLVLPAAIDNRERLPVADPVPTAPPVPALGDAVRDLARASTPAPAVEVVKSTILPAPREPLAKAPLVLPAAIDNRATQPVADPVPAAPPVPALGDAVRDRARASTPASAAEVVKSTILPAPREPLAKAPLVLPAATDNHAFLPVAEPMLVAPPVPALGDAVRDLAKASTPAPAAEVVKPTVLPALREPMAKAPLVLPAATDNRAFLPVADPVPAAPAVPALGDAVRDLAKASTPAPAGEVVKLTILPAPREPLAKAPFVLPAAIDNRERLPVANPVPAPPPVPALGDAVRDLARASTPAPEGEVVKPIILPAPRAPMTSPAPGVLGDVVRDMAKAVPSVPQFPEMAKPVKAAEPPKASAPKVEQSFTFAPNIPIVVHGDVKDPEQLVRELEPPLRRLWEAFQRDVSARMSSSQLFDQPHI